MPEVLVAQVIRRLLQLRDGHLTHQFLFGKRGTESRSASSALFAGQDFVFFQLLLGPAIDCDWIRTCLETVAYVRLNAVTFS